MIAIPILGLLAAIISYAGYFLSYSDTGFVFVIAAFLIYAIIYIVYFGLTAPPSWTLYAWLILFLMFPKHSFPPNSLLGIGFGFKDVGISLFHGLEIVAILAIAMAYVKRGGNKAYKTIPARIRLIYRLCILMAVTGPAGAAYQWVAGNLPDETSLEAMFVAYWPLLAALVLFPAFAAFIHSRKQVEFIFVLMIITALLTSLELFIYTAFDFHGLDHWAFGQYHKFRGAIHNDSLRLGLITMMGSFAAFYFAHIYKRKFFFLLIPFLLWPNLETHVRGVIFSTLLGFGFVYLIQTRKAGKWMGAAVIMAVLVSGLGFGSWGILKPVNQAIVGERQDIAGGSALSDGSLLTRMGAGMRGLEVFLYSPVVGVGPGNMVAFMSSDTVPGYFDMGNMAYLTSVYYNYIATGEHATGPHNFYVRLLEEYGIIALLMCGLAAYVLISRFRKLNSRGRNSFTGQYCSWFAVMVLSYAMLFSFGLFYFQQHTPLFYGVVAMLVWFTCPDPREWNGRCAIDRGRS